ncbi:MAG TPA: DUF971 domain-containing protein [Planctomycetes bacterium]|nr:DUF971 domain-containing protein [Planctomycetota bacterium]
MIMPKKLERIDNELGQVLLIEWTDDVTTSCSVRRIQENCPCANCGEKKGASSKEPVLLPIVDSGELAPLEIVTMRPAGNYAYAMTFSTGCNQGIYNFDLLRQLGDVQ